jgi:hypothetical protein
MPDTIEGSTEVIETDLGEGVYIIFEGARWQIEARDVPRLRQLVPDALLVAFARTFVGLDHLASMNDFLFLNGKQDEGVAKQRNLWTAVTMSWGILREIARALTDMKNAGIKGRIDKKEPWERLNAIRKRWETGALEIQSRNNLAFHLGKKDHYLKALRGESGTLVLVKGEDRAMRNSRCAFGLDLLLDGAGVSAERFRDFAQSASRDHFEITSLVRSLFVDVLRKAGVRFRELDE